MPDVVFPLDSTKKFVDQEKLGHNRWHPDIPAAVTVKQGDSFRVHCREWFDGAIVNDDSADDILNAPLTTVHVLSGPIAVEGARPGDLLIVDILDVGPIPQEDSGPWPARAGDTPAFSRRRTVVGSSPSSSRRIQGNLGLQVRRPPPGTCQVWSSPGLFTLA